MKTIHHIWSRFRSCEAAVTRGREGGERSVTTARGADKQRVFLLARWPCSPAWKQLAKGENRTNKNQGKSQSSISRPIFLSMKGLFVFLVICILQPPALLAQSQPNFVFIFADDLGFGDLACYGHPYADTPNLDRLAAEGTLFRQFHVNGNVCPVTRAGLMTGRNPSWFPNYTDDYSFMGATTITNILQDAGYTTGHIGKWNIGPNYDVEYVEYGIDDLQITGSITNDPRGKEGLRFDRTLDFLEKYQNEPFYLNLWIYATHTPIAPPQNLVDHFAGMTFDRNLFGAHMQEKFQFVEDNGGDVDENMRIYLGEVWGLDLQVGRLLQKLEDLGIADNTVVVFSSDNGPERVNENRFEALGYSGGLRGEKHSYFEGGTRVPFIVRWPGKVPAGRVDDESIMFGVDWLTTVASIAGADYDPSLFEGEDMSDVWLGNKRSRRNPLFFRQWNNFSKKHMRYGKWKLHVHLNELYDLDADEFEFNNIYGERPDIVAKMLESFDSWEATLPTGHARLPEAPLPFDPTEPAPDIILPDIDDAFPPQVSKTPTPEPIVAPMPSPSGPPSLRPTPKTSVDPTMVRLHLQSPSQNLLYRIY